VRTPERSLLAAPFAVPRASQEGVGVAGFFPLVLGAGRVGRGLSPGVAGAGLPVPVAASLLAALLPLGVHAAGGRDAEQLLLLPLGIVAASFDALALLDLRWVAAGLLPAPSLIAVIHLAESGGRWGRHDGFRCGGDSGMGRLSSDRRDDDALFHAEVMVLRERAGLHVGLEAPRSLACPVTSTLVNDGEALA